MLSAREVLMQEDCGNALARHTEGVRHVIVHRDDEIATTRFLANAGKGEAVRIDAGRVR